MISYNNSAPKAVNNVGQFGATEGSIGAYKSAAEYAADSKYWALLSQTKYSSVGEILDEVERLYTQGHLLEEDIKQLKIDFEAQEQILLGLIQSTGQAIDNTNAATELSREATQEVLAQLDIISNMTVQTTLLPPGSLATGSYDNSTGVFAFGIPEGQPGRDGTDGTISDIGSVPVGVPVVDDYGFYVDKDDGGLYRADMSDIANLVPSVRSISINGGAEQTGSVVFDSVSTFNGRKGTVVAESGDYTAAQVGAFSVSNNLSEITNTSAAITNIGLAGYGIGSSTLNAITSFDWQTFIFTNSARYYVRSSNMINAPAELIYTSDTDLFIEVIGAVGTSVEVRVVPFTGDNSSYVTYAVRGSGAAGSRTFVVRKELSSATPVTISQGGTGATTSSAARTNLGLGSVSIESIVPVTKGGTGVNNQAELWGVIRPIGATPLSADPVSTFDATTKGWTESAISTSIDSATSDIYSSLSASDGAAKIGHGSTTVAAKLNTMKSPFDYGAKGDGVTDDTAALQAYISDASGDIDLAGGTYLVSKNADLASLYPTEADFSNGGYNFSPCLAVVGKQDVKIHNGTLIVKTHGLDGLALVNCQNVTVTLNVKGPNKFPAIDPTTGYAEKGEVGFGYDSAQVLGPNNAVDTSGYISGAYSGVSGQFPNYNSDGSQAAGWRATWGTFLNGNIGSWACGIKVQRACKGVLITGCNLSGFNFSGVGIGIRNVAEAYGASDYTTESDVPDGVLVVNNVISNCYQAGIYVLSGYRLNYDANIITDIGHPDGNDVTNASYDPGYGITHGRNRRIRNVTVTNNQIRNCRRKAIDFHGGGQAIITGNHCLEHGVVGIYAKCGEDWSPNYECYNLIIANNYIRSRDIPASETTGLLVGAKYTRSIDVGGGGEATLVTYPEPFVKILNNYCELKAYDGVSIATGAGNASYVVFNDIDISHNTVVMKCTTSSNMTEGITVNAGAADDIVYRGQKVKLIGNSVKQFNTLNSSFRVVGYNVKGIPKSVTAHGNTLDCNVTVQTGMLARFILDSRTSISFEGNQALSYGVRSSVGIEDVIFYDNVKIIRPAGSAALSINGALYRGVWDLFIAGGGDGYGSRHVTFASNGGSGTAAEVVRSQTTGFIASFGLSASGLTVPAVTQETPVQINLKCLSAFDSVN